MSEFFLTEQSKKHWYKSFNFYDLRFLFSLPLQNFNYSSFFLFLNKNCFLTKTFYLTCTYISMVEKSYSYFNLDKKYTVITSNDKILLSLTNLVNRKVIFLYKNFVFVLPNTNDLNGLLKIYSKFSFKKSFISKLIRNPILLFKISYLGKDFYFFFFKVFNLSFSNFQKKINFLQFNIFFKKI